MIMQPSSPSVSIFTAAVVAFLAVAQAVGDYRFDLLPYREYRAEGIDAIVDGTFNEIYRSIYRAGHTIKNLELSYTQQTAQLIQKFGIAGDVKQVIERAKHFGTTYLRQVNDVVEETKGHLDDVIDFTELKIEAKVQHTRELPVVDRTLRIMHQIVWDVEDFVSSLVCQRMPVFENIVNEAAKRAWSAHLEAISTGDTVTGQKRFFGALHWGSEAVNRLLDQSAEEILTECGRANKVLRRYSQVLLHGGHEAERNDRALQ